MRLLKFKKILKRAVKEYEHGKYIVALKTMKYLEEDNIPQDLFINSLYLKGDIYYDIRKYLESAKIYSHIISVKKSDVAYSNRAIAYWELGEFKLALKDYLMAIKINPSNAMAQRGAGEMYLKLNMLNKAIYHLAKAIKLNPNSSETFTALGIVQYRQKNWLGAYKSLIRAIQINPKNEIAKKGFLKIEKIFQLH